MRFPQELAAGLDDENESLELWHNHLDTPSAPADALPGIDDIVMAMRAGVVRVGVVDNEANARVIRAGAKPVDPPEAARPWLLAAAALADIAIGARLGPHSDPVQARLDALEMTLAAAHVVGLVELEGLDPSRARRCAGASQGSPTRGGEPPPSPPRRRRRRGRARGRWSPARRGGAHRRRSDRAHGGGAGEARGRAAGQSVDEGWAVHRGGHRAARGGRPDRRRRMREAGRRLAESEARRARGRRASRCEDANAADADSLGARDARKERGPAPVGMDVRGGRRLSRGAARERTSCGRRAAGNVTSPSTSRPMGPLQGCPRG